MNPYAPPAQALLPGAAPGQGEGFWREGNCVVMSKFGCALPHRCVVCNEPAATSVPKKFYWHPAWVYLLILASLLIYIIVALVMRKNANVVLPVCERHAKRRKLGKLVGWVGCIGFFLLMVLGPAMSGGLELLLVGLVGLIASGITASLLTALARPKRIDDRLVWLKAGEPFLASIPTTAPQIMAHPMGGYPTPPPHGGYLPR